MIDFNNFEEMKITMLKNLKKFTLLLVPLLILACGSDKIEEKVIDKPIPQKNENNDIQSSNTSMHEGLSLNEVIVEFKACKQQGAETTRCKEYVGRAVCGFYEINDFVNPELSGGYIPYDQLIDFVKTSDKWEKIGRASKQSVLDEAQKRSNSMQATIAINDNDGGRNVAILVPGELKKSNSWGLNCPSVAMLFPNKPEESFVGKTLNYAWSRPDDIVIYGRK